MSTHLRKLPPDLITQAEAARLRGVTRQAIHKLVLKGRLNTYEVAGNVLIRRADVLAYEAGQPGRPKTVSGKKKNNRG